MKHILFINDTSYWHVGSKAVSQYIRSEASKLGKVHNVQEVRRNNIKIDLMIVNGEGTFHHTQNKKIARKLEAYTEEFRNIPIALVNSLFQDCDDLLPTFKKFDYINSRELLSYEYLKRKDIKSKIFLDFSFYKPVTINPNTSFNNEIVLGDFFLDIDVEKFEKFNFPRLEIMHEVKWDEFLSKVQDMKLYITGYHHSVYACCKTRTRFVPYEHNSHKIEGLFKLANVNIPIPKTASEVIDCVDWALENSKEYIKLFDFMDNYEKWTFKELEHLL